MRRLLLITAGCLAVAVVPLSAATEFVAMGDSITAGSSWPFSVESVFDCTGECSYGPSGENCGHVRRLDSWIDGWLGAGNHVVNEGVGAERTAAAVVRLPGVLDSQCPDSPGDCVAVILMHGTNDMCCSGVSPETARDNLGFMIDEAKSRNIDTLLMTVIRKVYAPNHNKWKTYKNLTLALAGTKNLQSVNPWLTLCAGTTCFNNKYWVDHPNSQCTAPGEGDGDIGHLDPNGYNDLTDLIKAVFPAAAPAAAVPTAPAGDLTDTQPDFVWPEVAETRWYELDVDGATTWWEAAVYCTGGTCTVDPGVGLAKGAHSWRVRGRNLRGMGAWSADTPFTVWGIPGTPVPSDPAGQFFDPTPTSAPFGWEPYTWSEDPEATDYDLVVSDGGGPVLTQSFGSSICVTPTCEASPGQGLGAGSHTWTVQARNPAVSGPVSGSLAFEIFDSAPGEPTPAAPAGNYFEPFAPLYEWLPVAGATEYDLEVKDAGGNVDAGSSGLLASAVCASGSCAHQGATLTDPDDYTLRVRGRNELGESSFSSVGAEFTVLGCADPSEQDLSVLVGPTPISTTEVVSHCGPVTAGEMPPIGPYTIDAAGDLTVHTRDGFRADDEFAVKGTLTVRSP